MSDWKAKRFWDAATVEPGPDGFAILLDGRPVRTPAKAQLILPTEALARSVSEEWAAQEGQVDPGTMPLTRAANAAIDKVTPQFAEVANLISDYGDSDLICYRADYPQGLVERQAQAWDPLMEWAAATFGARLEARSGVMHNPQSIDATAALSTAVHKMSAFELTALHDLVGLSGSLVIGLAVTKGFEAPESLWERSRVDELWQIEEWGEDEEAAQAAAVKKQEFLTAETFFRLSAGTP